MFLTPKLYLSLSLGAAILMGCASSSSFKETCPNPSLPCASAAISVMAMSDESGVLQMTGNNAAVKFTEIFGYPVPPTVIVPGGSISIETSADLRANGFKTLMPWISAADRLKLKESSVRRQIEEQTKDLPAGVREAAREQLMSQVNASTTSKTETEQAGALAHELSHMWFIATFKEEGAEDAMGHAYGGWAPDWLDETAAVLLENEALKEKRRSRFFKLSADERIPLSEFLRMEHPAAKTAGKLSVRKSENRASKAPKLKGKGVETRASMRVLTGEEAKAFLKASGGDRTITFYSQVLIFSDYLTARAGGTSIFPNIAEELATGKSISEWLASNRFGLPTTVSGLEADWTAWVLETEA